MQFDQVRERIILILTSLLVTAPLLQVYWPAGNGLDVYDHPVGRDFINVWSGPQVAFGDKVATLFDFPAYHAAIGKLFGQPLPFHNWSYPLYDLLIFWPFAQLPYYVALTVWTVGLFAVFATVVLGEIEPSRRTQALLLLALAPACLINVMGGQNGFLSAALFLGGVLNIDRRPVLAGVLIGLLIYKPHLGVVLPFALVALGAWRVIAAAAVTAVVLVAASVAVFGLDAWAQYLSVTGAFQANVLTEFKGFYITMMVSVFACLRVLGIAYAGGMPHADAMAMQAVVSVAAIVGATWAVRQVADPCVRAFILLTAALLATPYSFNYDLPALAAVAVWLMAGRLPWRPQGAAIYLCAWLAPPIVMYLTVWREVGLIAPFITLFYLFGMFALALREARGEGVPRLAAA